MLQTLTHSVDSLICESPCWIPPFVEEPGPALIVFPNLWGPNAYWDDMLDKFAGLGYVTMVVDMYGRETRPQTHEEAFAVINPLKDDRETVRRRALAALEKLQSLAEVDAERIVAVGYCFGGLGVLELARVSAPVLGVVSLHGTLGSPMAVSTPGAIKPSVLAMHGAEDPSIQDPEVTDFIAEMRVAEADWQLVHFGGQVHAFSDRMAKRPGVSLYDARTDERSWGMLVQFIEEKFG